MVEFIKVFFALSLLFSIWEVLRELMKISYRLEQVVDILKHYLKIKS